MKKLVLLVVFGVTAFITNAQEIKVGYADPDYIMGQLPEAKQIESELKTLQTQLKTQIDSKYQEFQRKVKDYNDNVGTMLVPVKENTERELQQLQQNLEKLQQDAQTTIQTKQQALMQPVYAKIGKGIEDVAKENSISLVLSNQVGGLDVVLFADEKLDISDLVLKKLGVTPTKPADGTTTQPTNNTTTNTNKPATTTTKPK
jgi:outer membrane protein